MLNHLLDYDEIHITVLAGKEIKRLGHFHENKENKFKLIKLNTTKNRLSFYPFFYFTILQLLFNKRYDFLVMPIEVKHLPVILFLFFFKFIFNYELVSYNHPFLGKKMDAKSFFFIKFLFLLYDRVIFYTKDSMLKAIKMKLVSSSKAFFANNTIDTKLIWDNYDFQINLSEPKTLLFIGRLIPNKNIDALLTYYSSLKKMIPSLRLIIIGEGPESYKIKNVIGYEKNILWKGGLIDEKMISEIMRECHAVFIPGHSGLSIVHAFCYGKPYLTFSTYNCHPPEIEYLIDGKNGYFLSGNIEKDCIKIFRLLTDQQLYSSFCRSAYKKAKELTVHNWCNQMVKSFQQVTA